MNNTSLFAMGAMNNTSLFAMGARLTTDGAGVKPVNYMELVKFILGVMGVVGNTLAAVVWAEDRRKSSSSLFLLCLSVYDLLYLGGSVISLVFYFERFTNLNFSVLSVQIANNVLSIVYNSALCGSSLSTVAITAERYLAVTKPLKVILVCSRKRAKMVVISIASICCVYASLYSLYVYLIVIPVLRNADHSNLSRCYNEEGQSIDGNVTLTGMNWVAQYKYDLALVVGQALLVYVVPWLAILVLNILILKEMITSDFGTKFRSSARRHLEKRLVLSVMAVCALSLVSHPVGFVGLMLPLFVQGRVEESSSYLSDTWNILKLINSGANFIFYSTISAQFRKTLLQKLKCAREESSKCYCCRGYSASYSSSEQTVTCG